LTFSDFSVYLLDSEYALNKGQRAINLFEGLIHTLSDLPGVAIHSMTPEVRVDGRMIDAIIPGEVKGRPVRFLVECKASGYPRDMQAAIWQMEGKQRLEQPVADVPIVAAPAITETSRALLRRHHTAYWDASGSLYLDLPWAFYWLDRPVPAGRPRVLRDIYRGSSAQVLHALLLEPDREWHITDLARHAGVAASTAHQVCHFLEEELWMDKAGAGPRAVRTLREPGALIDAWAEAHSLAEYAHRRFHRWSQHPAQLRRIVGDALTRHGIEYALTLSSGAQLVAPHGTEGGHAWALVPASAPIEEVARAAGLRAVEEGESVTLLATRDRSSLLFRRQVDDLWVASDIQLYLDLWAWPRRGKEQARHLRAERLGY
jgi:hypothetical protein